MNLGSDTVALRGVDLAPWQQDAVEAWCKGDGKPYRGTLEIFTGGGKTLIALACIERVARTVDHLHVAIVAPTEALVRQWREVLLTRTNLTPNDIGIMGAGSKEEFQSVGPGPRVVIAVLNSAAKKLPSTIQDPLRTMLVIDECHRAGAPKFSKVLDTPAAFRLGLSATPDREELDDDGELLRYDEQAVGSKLGSIVFRWMLRDARAIGWLPSFQIHHHGVLLRPNERHEYEAQSRRVDEAADRLRSLGVESGRAQHLRSRGGDIGNAAQTYVAATASRKNLLYLASERHRLTVRLVSELLDNDPLRRIILFHERIDEAIALHGLLTEAFRKDGQPICGLALEHSRLGTRQRQTALQDFRSGKASVLVSVKSLVEGIDVPAADVGISVASSSSVRQRIQSLGRVLRRQFTDPDSKRAEMHIVYVADTVDEVIYGKQDWSDITGDGTNSYWKWTLDEPSEQVREEGPPRTPRPTEEMEWERLGGIAPLQPVRWLGEAIGQEYSVDTLGTVVNASKAVITNPQHAGELVTAVRGRPGGRFRVTPLHRIVLVWGEDTEGTALYAAGQLVEPFSTLVEAWPESDGRLPLPKRPGDRMPSRPDKENGTFALRNKRGGVIERKVQGGLELALTEDAHQPEMAANATRVIEAWKGLFDRGITFFVSSDFTAWYVEQGTPRFLGSVPGGFCWPTLNEKVQL